ncbi:MAG: dual specificity protein phosphatase family protein [Granulosicoccus sp.]|nr:dual specificity protein phosphatase family protein [Granulosicoccus sp.]
MEQFSKFNCTLVQGVQKGVNTVIHCRAGIGRSGLVAIGVLLTQRVALGRAIEQVSAARLEEVPETPAQLNWLQEYEHYRRSEATGR